MPMATPRLALLRLASKAGLVIGAAFLAFFFTVEFLADANPLSPVRYLDYGLQLLALVFVFWYIKNGRDRGRFHFWEGLFVGFVSSIVAGVVQAAVLYPYLAYVAPETLKEYIDWSVNMATLMKPDTVKQFGEKGFQDLIVALHATSPADIATDIMIKRVVGSVIIVPLVAALMRKTVLLVHE